MKKFAQNVLCVRFATFSHSFCSRFGNLSARTSIFEEPPSFNGFLKETNSEQARLSSLFSWLFGLLANWKKKRQRPPLGLASEPYPSTPPRQPYYKEEEEDWQFAFLLISNIFIEGMVILYYSNFDNRNLTAPVLEFAREQGVEINQCFLNSKEQANEQAESRFFSKIWKLDCANYWKVGVYPPMLPQSAFSKH